MKLNTALFWGGLILGFIVAQIVDGIAVHFLVK